MIGENINAQQPLVSIISPTYNHEKFIAVCIESVLAQTYTNWEMIVVDDGSTDSTYEIACNWAKKDSRIRSFTQKNIGIFRLGESYNFGLKQSSGKYIAVLECDDVWLPDKLQIQVDALEQKPECILSWGKAYLSSVDLSSNYYLAPRNDIDINLFYNKPVGIFLKKFIYSTLIPALTLVIRRDALLEIGGFVQGFGLPLVDIPTTLELLMRGEFAYIDKPLGSWRIYPNQVTKTYTGQMTTSYYALIQSFMQRFPEAFIEHKLTKEVIEDHFRNRLVVSYSRSGRYKLIRKDFKGARKDYLHSITHYGFTQPIWKLRSVVGIIFSLFRMDVEWLARLIGHDSYKKGYI
jgi:glycosyltransferase involved in cell wall biosynthesis